MSNVTLPRRSLHLVIDGFPVARLEELTQPSSDANATTEIFPLTEANAREALDKIFNADTVAVWSHL